MRSSKVRFVFFYASSSSESKVGNEDYAKIAGIAF